MRYTVTKCVLVCINITQGEISDPVLLKVVKKEHILSEQSYEYSYAYFTRSPDPCSRKFGWIKMYHHMTHFNLLYLLLKHLMVMKGVVMMKRNIEYNLSLNLSIKATKQGLELSD